MLLCALSEKTVFRRGMHVTGNTNILFINPWIHDFAAYDFWIKPLGLLSIASLLRANNYNVALIDCLNPLHPQLAQEPGILLSKRKSSGHGKFPKAVIPKPEPLQHIPKRYHRYGITPRLFRQALDDHPRPSLVLVTSMMTYWYPGVFEAIRIVREALPGVPIVLGGNYVNLCPDHATASGADFTVQGAGEKVIPSLLRTILGRGDLSFMPDYKNLDTYPYPAFDLLDLKDQVPILTSRGCPYCCTYCASHLLNETFLRRDPGKVADEISYWHKRFGIRHFSFYDDALLVNPHEMIIPLLKEVIRQNRDCQFHCPNGMHLREITPEISKLMFRAGFKTIRFGFETSDENNQEKTGGKVNNAHFIQAVSYLKEAGYERSDIGIYILCGLPGQACREVRDTIEYVHAKGAKPVIAEYSPIPGTALWPEAVKSSRYDISSDPLFHNNSLLPCQGEALTFDMYNDLKSLTRTRSERQGMRSLP